MVREGLPAPDGELDLGLPEVMETVGPRRVGQDQGRRRGDDQEHAGGRLLGEEADHRSSNDPGESGVAAAPGLTADGQRWFGAHGAEEIPCDSEARKARSLDPRPIAGEPSSRPPPSAPVRLPISR